MLSFFVLKITNVASKNKYCYHIVMKIQSRIILPIAILFVGIVTVMMGRTASVGADATSVSSNSSLYILLTASGFLLIAVAAIVALFMIAAGEDQKK